jgi:putative oxidoreductase
MATTDATTSGYDSASTDPLSSFGLLVLRFATGATMVQAGLIKAFDLDSVVEFMEGGGWRMPKFAALLVTVTETAGGVALLLGLLTPVAACAVVAAMIDAWAVNVSAGAFWSEPFNVPFLVALGATALLFTGAGAFSVDAKLFGRTRWPGFVTVGLFVVAVAAAVATWVLLNGSNPIHFSSPQG